jgi:hypothetical protein
MQSTSGRSAITISKSETKRSLGEAAVHSSQSSEEGLTERPEDWEWRARSRKTMPAAKLPHSSQQQA